MNIQEIIRSAFANIMSTEHMATKDQQVKYYINHKIDELEDVILGHNQDSKITRDIISKLEAIKLRYCKISVK